MNTKENIYDKLNINQRQQPLVGTISPMLNKLEEMVGKFLV